MGFEAEGVKVRNIVASIGGSCRHGEILVLGAHDNSRCGMISLDCQ